MKKEFLFPHRFKKIGWLMFFPGLIGCVCTLFFPILDSKFFTIRIFAFYSSGFLTDYRFCDIIENCITDEVLISLMIVGGILVSFSKTVIEDEYVSQLRYESLVWAVYFNFGLMLLATLLVFDTPYLTVMMFNIFSLLLFFIIRFHFKLFQLQKSTKDDQ